MRLCGRAVIARLRSCSRFSSAGVQPAAALGAPGCAAPETAAGYSGSGTLSDYFASSSSAKAPQTATGAQPDVNCPPVEIRQGASTLTIGPNGDKSAMTLKYQGTFVRAARECAVAAGNW